MQGSSLKVAPHYWWQSSQNHNIWDRGEVRGRLLLAKIVGCCIPCSVNLCGCIGYIYCWNDFSNGLWAKNLSNLPQIASRLCGMHISETAGWIYPIWNFMDLARPVVVQRHITHAPLIRGGADNVYESALGDSSLVMNIHNSFMDCATSQYIFKPRDVIMLMRAVTIVAA